MPRPLGFVLVLSYDGLGSVHQIVQAVKAHGLIPLVVSNKTKFRFIGFLSPALVLKSSNVNRDHRALAAEIVETMARYSGRRDSVVSAILNSIDRMWICYVDLISIFIGACGVDREAVVRTTIKPNLRFLLKGTTLHVNYHLWQRQKFEHGYLDSEGHLGCSEDVVLVVKPVVGMGGAGVSKIEIGPRKSFHSRLRQAAMAALATQRAIYDDGLAVEFLEFGSVQNRRPINDFVLVEEFLEGDEYSLEGYALKSGEFAHFVLQKKTRTESDQSFRDFEYVAPVPSPSEADVSEFLAPLLVASGLEYFPFHIEMKGIDQGALRLIEFNPRAGGGSIVELVSSIKCVDIRQLGISRILSTIAKTRFLATFVLQPHKPGRLIGFSGLEKAAAQPDCVFVRPFVRRGAQLRVDIEMYLVEVCVVGQDEASARRRAMEVANLISVSIS
jgi:hypothetical protein